jgi:hypothetical protein
MLEAYTHRPHSVTPAAARGKPSGLRQAFSGIAGLFRSKSSNGAAMPSTGLPVHKHDGGRDPYGCLETTTPTNNTPAAAASSCGRLLRAQHHFLLLCLPFMRWGVKLHQSEVCRVNSDRLLPPARRSLPACEEERAGLVAAAAAVDRVRSGKRKTGHSLLPPISLPSLRALSYI